jgi:hypothetical protein
MTAQQRRALLICLGIVVGSYITHSIIITAMQMAYYQQQAARQLAIRAAQQRAKAAATTAHAPAPPAATTLPPTSQPTPAAGPPAGRAAIPAKEVTPPSPFARFQGIWRGRAALDSRGICDLRFELREKPDEPGNFSGYSTMTCSAVGALMPGKQVSVKEQTLNVMDPEAAIFTGKPENGSLQFHVDKTVGADSNGCAPTAFTLTPFGGNQLAAEWREATCRGGHMILGRARQ